MVEAATLVTMARLWAPTRGIQIGNIRMMSLRKAMVKNIHTGGYLSVGLLADVTEFLAYELQWQRPRRWWQNKKRLYIASPWLQLPWLPIGGSLSRMSIWEIISTQVDRETVGLNLEIVTADRVLISAQQHAWNSSLDAYSILKTQNHW